MPLPAGSATSTPSPTGAPPSMENAFNNPQSTVKKPSNTTGWTEFSASEPTKPPSSNTSNPSPPPININHVNYIVNNITVKVTGREDEPQPPLVPKPPETARPSNPTPSIQPTTANTSENPASATKPTAVSHYAVGKTIGEGTFGKVKLGMHKLTGIPVAIKILEKERIVDLADVSRVKREIHILTRVRHPNVIRLFEVIDSPRHIFLIMEHASGGELFDYIVSQGRVKEDQACKFFHQILNGTDYFHNKNIIHRDLKPENLLLTTAPGSTSAQQIKIVDFGLGNVIKNGKLLKTACGSPCYAAPEMIAGKKYVGPGCDMWSLGVILFALLCGYLPFEDANTARLYEKIMGGEYEIPDFVSSDGRDLISKLLNTDPRKRYNAEQVRRHVWYARMNVPTDPLFTGEDANTPIVPGPQASGKKVKRTISGQLVDDEHEIDQDIIRHMVMLGYHPQQVMESINSNRHDHFAATYHLLLIKKQMGQPQQKTGSAAGTTKPSPPTVPRIQPNSAAAGPSVPSAPVASHHHPQPPTTQKPVTSVPRPVVQAAFMNTAPLPQQVSQTPPLPTSTISGGGGPPGGPASARVQSAGTVRPVAPTQPYPSSITARPTTSHHQAKVHGSSESMSPYAPSSSPNSKSDHPPHAAVHNAWNDPASSHTAPSISISNGVNGGAGVNAYMQHYQQAQQQAAAAAAAAAAMYATPFQQQQQQRPPSSSPRPPSSQGHHPNKPPAHNQPGSARNGATTPTPTNVKGSPTASSSSSAQQQHQQQQQYPQRATSSQGARGGRGGKNQIKGVVPVVQQQLFISNPLDVNVATPMYPNAPHSARAAALSHAIGPATGRPMTSRITGSTGGVSHRLYFPPSEKAAHDLAMAAAAAAAAAANGSSRPQTGSGVRPGSSMGNSRPGTSNPSNRRPPSSTGGRGTSQTRSNVASAYGGKGASARERERERERELLEDIPLDELEWTGSSSSSRTPNRPSSSVHGGAGGSSTAASTSSAFNTQLSAMSFKPMRSIIDELQRVMHTNGLQFSLLPPSSSQSGSATSPTSPLAKHGFVPASLGAPTAASNLAPISISSLRPAPRGAGDDGNHNVLEVRQGSHRFQFHIAPITSASASYAKALAADLDNDGPTMHSSAASSGGYAIRVKRVLGDAATFKDICSKLLPQLKL